MRFVAELGFSVGRIGTIVFGTFDGIADRRSLVRRRHRVGLFGMAVLQGGMYGNTDCRHLVCRGNMGKGVTIPLLRTYIRAICPVVHPHRRGPAFVRGGLCITND